MNANYLPNFVIIGAPKCGTTSLYYYLYRHPQIFLPNQKELHFFSYDFLSKNMNGPGDKNMLSSICKTFDEYQSHYKSAGNMSAVGEFSPSYLYFDKIASRISSFLNNPKIIVMLRNPVDKAFSQYMHLVRSNRETLPFDVALDEEENRIKAGWSDFWRYVDSSFYTAKLRTYFDLFGPDKIKVVIFDEFTKNPNEVVKEICGFIGVDNNILLKTDKIYNRSGTPRIRFLAKLLSQPNILKSILKRTIPTSARTLLRLKLIDINTITNKNDLSVDLKKRLNNYFKEDISELELLIGKKLPWDHV